MDRDQADIIIRAIEAGSDGRWPHVRDTLLEAGYKPKEIVAASAALADIAGVDNPFDLGDF